jgi:hypothetical protein
MYPPRLDPFAAPNNQDTFDSTPSNAPSFVPFGFSANPNDPFASRPPQPQYHPQQLQSQKHVPQQQPQQQQQQQLPQNQFYPQPQPGTVALHRCGLLQICAE